MASVKVAVRVRPLNAREIALESKFIIEMDGNKTTIFNPKMIGSSAGDAARERMKSFSYDYSYWTVDKLSPNYASQVQVFTDLGMDVIHSAYDGYNACVFAYGQTGSGKTYTMMGDSENCGLIPRICQELFARMSDPSMTYRAEVSYLEVYNERVRDLLHGGGGGDRPQHSLRVREHPKDGPYVQDLSKHIVLNYNDIKALMDTGNANRTTASTNMNDVSSRSHAIFTICFTQAKFSTSAPSETHSKIHLVDLAGSERADATGATGQRLKEGSSINRSLVTLGNVISSLADLSEKMGTTRKTAFIPYRDSVLTWLLKDSLGGNSKTIMIAAISPADCNYPETLSTLRYANRAKNIINKPTVNEDANVKLIKELRSEIARLKALLGGKSDDLTTPRVQEKLHENEARVKVLTEEWAGKWKEMAEVLQEDKQLALRKQGLGIVLDSDLPHLIGIDDDILSTGIMLYHIKEGKTTVGTGFATEKQDIVLQGEEVEPEHCIIEHVNGHVTIIPLGNALCTINGTTRQDPVKLTQGAVILLGRTNMFRFNHPAQAARMREDMKGSNLNTSRMSSLSQSMNDMARSTENLALLTSGWEMEQRHHEQLEALEQKRQQIEELEESHRMAEAHRLAEQETRERELEEKREQLESMHHQAEHLKKEAEEMQQAVVKEAAKLKRRSMDIEKHYQEILAQKEEQQLQIAKLKQQKEAEEDHKKAVHDDLRKLAEEEQLEVEKAQSAKQQLLQELADIKAEQELHRSLLEEDKRRLELEEEEQLKKLQELEEEIKKKREELQAQCNKELEMITQEREHLEALKKEHESFYKFTALLDSGARERLELELHKIQKAHSDVAKKEKELYQLFKKEHDAIMERKETSLKAAQDERLQLEADKVYLQECQNRYDQELENSDPNNEEVQEQLIREKIAIETEQERIVEDEEKLAKREEEIKDEAERELKELQSKRDLQVESIIQDKEKLKLLEHKRKEMIDQEIIKKNEQFEQVVVKMNEEERQLKALEKQKEESRNSLAEERRQLESQRLLLEETGRAQEKSAQEAIAQLDSRRERLEEKASREMNSILDKKKRLEQLERTSIMAADDIQLRNRIEELRCLEDQLQRSEAELEERRERYEHERQEELDKIDWEKFKLQEMEEMERINALVEQEVKRRLLEERVQREKQRRMEREKEKLERDQELSKIKRAHERELQRLKEKYEANNCLYANAPTKANPYANTMANDAGMRPSPRRLMENGRPSSEENAIIEISIPTFIMRGSALDVHYEFEIKLKIGPDSWSVYRRYSRFRDLHADLKEKYPQISALVFPPKKWFGNRSERVVAERRKLLEDYLRNVFEVLRRNPNCPLHPTQTKIYRKQVLHDFHPFFKKGLFEVSKHGTA